jgi:transporter family protein
MNWITWSVLSALAAAMAAIFGKIGVEQINSNVATALRTTIVLLFTWMIALVWNRPLSLSAITPRTWLFLTLSALATGLSWLCYFRALQLGTASRVAPIDKLSVVFVVILAALFLKEPVTAKTFVGAAMIAGGAIVLALK